MIESELEINYKLFSESSLVFGDIVAPFIESELRLVFGPVPFVQADLFFDESIALFIENHLGIEWSCLTLVENELAMSWHCVNNIIESELDMKWHCVDLNEPIYNELSIGWSCLGVDDIDQYYNIKVEVDGLKIDFIDVTISEAVDQYLITATITFGDAEYYNMIQELGLVQIITPFKVYLLLVKNKTVNESISGDTVTEVYTVNAWSKTMLLDQPYSVPVEYIFRSNTTSKTAIMSLLIGYTVSYQMINFPIEKNTLIAGNEHPIEMIRKIILNKGIMQTGPTGQIYFTNKYDVEPEEWDSAIPDHTLSTGREIISYSEFEEEKPGTDKVIVSNQQQSSGSFEFDTEKVGTDKFEIRGYEVPFTGKIPELQHSAGLWAKIIIVGIVTEQVTDERVEVIDGVGSLQHPFYDLVDIHYHDVNLGMMVCQEDGSFTTDEPGNSLVDVVYKTKFYEWTVFINEPEKVLLYIEFEND